MAASSNILREYLVSLGYSVDGASQRKFDDSLFKTNLTATGLVKTLVGATTAAQVFVAVFARSMEKLYYSSKLASTSAGNLTALDFGARTIGVQNFTETVKRLAMNIRQNPGLLGLATSLGIKVDPNNIGKVATDLVKQLKGMPFEVSNQFASMFGISPEDFLLMTQGIHEMEKAVELRKQMAEAAGLDLDKATESGKVYSNMLREVTGHMEILKELVGIALLPIFEKAAVALNGFLANTSKMVGDANAGKNGGWAGAFQRFGDNAGNWIDKMWIHPEAAKTRKPKTAPGATQPAEVASSTAPGSMQPDGVALSEKQQFLNGVERTYGLEQGTLDKYWKQESGRGVNKGPSKAGATGDFQFMPKTKAEFNAGDTFESQADAAARKIRGLLKRYGGDDQLAAMAYNLGEGNLDKVLNGQRGLPDETRKYGEAISGRPVTVQQNTTIQVTSDDPATAGRSVSREQFRVNEQLGSVVRNQTANAS